MKFWFVKNSHILSFLGKEIRFSLCIRAICIIALCFMSVEVAGRNESRIELEKFLKDKSLVNKMISRERTYLHFDNTAYFLGETIWFKAYMIYSEECAPSDRSQILYVEFINSRGDVLQTQKLRITDGEAAGAFSTEFLLTSGFYQVRAFTRSMAENRPEAVFSRVLPVFEAPKDEGNHNDIRIRFDKKAPEPFQVCFYPEGGHLVEGLDNRVAFSITDKQGLPCEATGWLIDDDDTLAIVNTMREGRGVFHCIPQKDHRITLVLHRPDGNFLKASLPPVAGEGCTLQADMRDSSLVRIKIEKSPLLSADTLGLLLMHRGNLISFQRVSSENQAVSYVFPRTCFEDGVHQLAIINCHGQILAERMLFFFPQKSDRIKLTLNSSLQPYGEVVLEATTVNPSTFSIAIHDADTDVNDNKGNLATWLLLESELKGYVHQADYYLESNDVEHRMASDLLMMVQGWSCHDYPSLRESGTVERNLSLLGQLVSKKRKLSVADIELNVVMYNKDGKRFRGKTRTDGKGFFSFCIPECQGEWVLLLQAGQEGKENDFMVKIDRHFSPLFHPFSPLEMRILPNNKRHLLSDIAPFTVSLQTKTDSIGILLPDVEVKKRRSLLQRLRNWKMESYVTDRSVLCYNVDRELEDMLDKGESIPSFFEWLISRNKDFSDGSYEEFYDTLSISENIRRQKVSYRRKARQGMNFGGGSQTGSMSWKDKGLYDNDIYRRSPVGGEIGYKGRPVIWVLDDELYLVSNSHIVDWQEEVSFCMPPSPYMFPDQLDNVKKVYISEDETISHDYILSSRLSHPITVFVYTNRQHLDRQEGLRQTYFEGYSPSRTFEMPDYSILPPERDFRRTLYWNPCVKTDSTGRATIRFWNNSRCNRLSVSAEGFDANGPLLYKE